MRTYDTGTKVYAPTLTDTKGLRFSARERNNAIPEADRGPSEI